MTGTVATETRLGVDRGLLYGPRRQPPQKGIDVNKPTGLKALPLKPDAASDDRCELAKSAYNSAKRGKQAYQSLVFVLAIVLVVAGIYALIEFKDEKTARGFLALVTAVGTLVTTGVLGVLAKNASRDEAAMWKRVEKSCQ
ncbi:MAG: hypothetical protein ACR2LK_04725 [Solirubrobacteraceae bacterium]